MIDTFYDSLRKRFSIRNISIQKRLPLIISVLLLSIILIFSLISYFGIKEVVLETGHARVKALSVQLGTLFQTSTQNSLAALAKSVNNEKLRLFLDNNASYKDEVLDILDELDKPEDSLALTVELRDKDYNLILQMSDKVYELTDHDLQIISSIKNSNQPTVGKFRSVEDSVHYPIFVPIVFDNNTKGFLVKWRLLRAAPKSIKQVTDLIGGQSSLYLSNNDRTGWNNLIKKIPAPHEDNNNEQEILEYEQNGKVVIASEQLIPGTPWMVLVEISKKRFTETADIFLRRTITIGIFLLLLGIFLAWVVSRTITKPLNKLTIAASDISAGDYSAKVKLNQNDELGTLANAFNMMVSRVRSAQTDLEKKVDERTLLLKKANEELEDLNRKLKELDELKTNFFTNVSHELRTPLALILGPAEKILSTGILTNENEREILVIQQNARILLKHVNNLLDLAKLEVGKMQIDYCKMDIASVARVLKSYFDSHAREQKIEFVLDAPENLIVEADPEKLERIMINLFSNAFKHTPDGGFIRCSLNKIENEAVFEIRDSGHGISDELLNTIFERFHSAKGLKRNIGSTGLGLSIVKEFIELHGGRIDAGNAKDGGAIFRFAIPLDAPEGVLINDMSSSDLALFDSEIKWDLAKKEVHTQYEQNDNKKEPAEVDGLPLILVVEDNPEMNRFISGVLRNEYNVISAFDGDEGLMMATKYKPHLIITDIMMPKKSGDVMTRELKADPELSSIPVILLTAKADEELKIELLKIGALDYLNKPFAMEELRARAANGIKIKLAKDLLQLELNSKNEDVISLLNDLMQKKHQIELSLEEKNLLLQELHHRVKNNLQIILSLLNLQLKTIKDPESIAVFEESRHRIGSMALVHEKLYKSGNFKKIDFADYVEELVNNLINAYGSKAKIRTIVDINEIYFNLDESITLGLIISEIITNALKYAFTDVEEGVITVILNRENGYMYNLIIKDNGAGMPHDFNIAKTETLGLILISTLVDQLEGELDIKNNNGTEVKIDFTLIPKDQKRTGEKVSI